MKASPRTIAAGGAGLALLVGLGATLARRGGKAPPLRTVDYVDLERYQGRWFEIARYPASFERQCSDNSTAQYTPRSKGRIRVVNTCVRENGKLDVVTGSAKVADRKSNAKLKVKFNPLMPSGDYWIIDLAPDYSYAVVGEPKRRFLWILARSPQLPEQTFNEIGARLADQQYDPGKLIRTKQI